MFYQGRIRSATIVLDQPDGSVRILDLQGGFLSRITIEEPFNKIFDTCGKVADFISVSRTIELEIRCASGLSLTPASDASDIVVPSQGIWMPSGKYSLDDDPLEHSLADISIPGVNDPSWG